MKTPLQLLKTAHTDRRRYGTGSAGAVLLCTASDLRVLARPPVLRSGPNRRRSNRPASCALGTPEAGIVGADTPEVGAVVGPEAGSVAGHAGAAAGRTHGGGTGTATCAATEGLDPSSSCSPSLSSENSFDFESETRCSRFEGKGGAAVSSGATTAAALTGSGGGTPSAAPSDAS